MSAQVLNSKKRYESSSKNQVLFFKENITEDISLRKVGLMKCQNRVVPYCKGDVAVIRICESSFDEIQTKCWLKQFMRP